MARGEGRGSDSDTEKSEGVRMDCGGRTKTTCGWIALKVLIGTPGWTEGPLLNDSMKFQKKWKGLEEGSGSQVFHLALEFCSHR